MGDYILSGVYLTVGACLVTWLIGEAIYVFKRTPLQKWLKYIFSFIIAVTFLFPVFAINIWVKTPIRSTFDGWIGIAMIVVMLIVLGIYQKISRFDKIINRPIYYYIVFQATVGIITRLPFFENQIVTKNGKLVLAGILVIGLLVFWLVSWRMLKKLENEK